MASSHLVLRYLRPALRLSLAFCLASILGAGTVQAQVDCSTQTDVPQIECEALVEMYDTMGGPGWFDYNWTANNSPCSWTGIQCQGGHIISLFFYETFLSGSFPASIGDLSFLERLSLHFETALFPGEFFTLDNLQYLKLQNCSNTNVLDSRLADLDSLETLILIESWPPGGPAPIPTFLGNLTGLRHLELDFVRFTGVFPAELNDLTNLEVLRIVDNPDLTGPLPAEWVFFSQLEELDLSRNSLTGTLPNGWGNLANLRILNLQGNGLFSFVPPLWSGLTTLEELDLGQNSLTGPIPAAWGSFPDLVTLDLEDNRFTGGVAADLGDSTAPADRVLRLANNHLEGEVPGAWEDGPLAELSISHNCLTTEDVGLAVYLDGLDPGWLDTQCLPLLTDGFEDGNTGAWDLTVDGVSP